MSTPAVASSPERTGGTSEPTPRGAAACAAAHVTRYPVLSGAAAGTLLTALLLLQQALLGRSPFGAAGNWNDVWVAILHCALAAYVPVATIAVVRNGRRTAAELRVATGADDYVTAAGGAGGALPWLLAALLGLALGFYGPWLTEPELGGPASFWVPTRWAPEMVWHRIGSLWIGPWVGAFAWAQLKVSRTLSRTAEYIPSADLFDVTPFLPVLRLALGHALAAAGLVALVGLLGLDHGVTLMLLAFGGGAVAITALAATLPLLGARRRRAAVRAAELIWCDEEIRAAHGRMRAGYARAVPGHLADLVAYRSRVEATSPWPVDFPMARRFALYLLIPLLSWVAAAIVQELVLAVIR